MTPNLPYNTTFAALGELLGCYAELGFVGWSLHVRTLAYRHNGDWFNFATTVWMEDGEREISEKKILRENVALVDFCTPLGGPLSPHELAKALTYWRSALGMSFGLTFQETIQLNRNPSDSRTNTWPGWWTQLHAQGGQSSHPLPDGPFFDPAKEIFGQDLPRLAMQFLGHAKYANTHNAPNEYIVRIPDRRARISTLRVEDNVLRLEVDNPATLKLFWSVVAASFADDVFSKVITVKNDRASVELPFAVQRLETWLILEDGYMLDQYQENPHYSTWGSEASLFNSSRHTESIALIQALAAGENDYVEFKPYIKVKQPRDTKAFEILETVSAFANAGGGNLYIGVNDAAEAIGVETQLNRDYGPEHGEAAARQAAYEKDLRKLINEGTAPSLELAFHWYDLAHRAVLHLRIPPSEDRVYLPENGEIYRRAGATNKKWRPIDAMPNVTPKRDPFAGT